MNATPMVSGPKEISPKAKARLIGSLLLITILAGGFAQGFVAGRLIVSGDATATATNILAHQRFIGLRLRSTL
jgi:hypothetical protein